MLPTNTMSYGSDSFAFKRQALLKSKACFDLSEETSCNGFEILGTEPPNTKRRIIFQIEGKLYKFGNGGLIEYEGRGEFSDIIEGGNTVAELLTLETVPDFIGKKIYPVIALEADAAAQIMPKIQLKLKVNCFNDRYLKEELSPVYNLRDNAKISEIRSSTYLNGHATCNLYCRLNNPVTGWGEWIFLPDAQGKFATQIQFKINYKLTTLDGSDFAGVNYIQCLYSGDAAKLSGSTQEIISLAQDYPSDLKTAYLLVKHSELIDAEMKAYVNFSAAPARRENVSLGVTTGEEQTFALAYNAVIDKNVVGNSIHIEVGGKTFTGFHFDTENSTVTLKAAAGQTIYGSWDCGLDNELWREMQLDYSLNQGNFYASRFIYRIAEEQNKKVAAIKIVLTRLSGNVDTYQIGAGTGALQIFALPHKAKIETLSASGAWKYDEESQLLKTVTSLETPITAGYSWQGQLPQIFSYIAGFSVS